MKTLLSPLKSVIPVTFTPNPGLFSWKFPPSPPFESTNKPAERSEGFFPRLKWYKKSRANFMSGSKIEKWAYIGGYLWNIGPFESARSDGVVR